MILRRCALHHDIAVHPKSHSLLVQPVGLTVVEMYRVGKIYIRTPPTPPTPGPEHVPPPRIGRPPCPSIRTYPGMTRTPAPFTAIPRRTRRSSLIHGKQTRFVRESTPTLPLSFRAISPPTAQRPNRRTPRLPLPAPRRVRRIRALSRLPKSRQPATPSLFPKDQSRSRPPREDSTLPVPPPPSTRKLL